MRHLDEQSCTYGIIDYFQCQNSDLREKVLIFCNITANISNNQIQFHVNFQPFGIHESL